jgi:hypothetical protein
VCLADDRAVENRRFLVGREKELATRASTVDHLEEGHSTLAASKLPMGASSLRAERCIGPVIGRLVALVQLDRAALAFTSSFGARMAALAFATSFRARMTVIVAFSHRGVVRCDDIVVVVRIKRTTKSAGTMLFPGMLGREEMRVCELWICGM